MSDTRKRMPQEWYSVCDLYRVSIRIAVQIEAGLLAVEDLSEYPDRELWHLEYQTEKRLKPKARRRRRPKVIARALNLYTRDNQLDTATALAVWTGKISAQEACTHKWARQKP